MVRVQGSKVRQHRSSLPWAWDSTLTMAQGPTARDLAGFVTTSCGVAGVCECEGPPSAWRFGTYLPMVRSINITTWGVQACAWCQARC